MAMQAASDNGELCLAFRRSSLKSGVRKMKRTRAANGRELDRGSHSYSRASSSKTTQKIQNNSFYPTRASLQNDS
jgi:hypothetical protein